MAAIPKTATIPEIPIPEFEEVPGFKDMSPDMQTKIKGMMTMGANSAIYLTCQQAQLKRVKDRCCTDQWLDENEREWYSLDAMMRRRPWATRKDEPFPYPFKTVTDEMRAAEGPWVGDDKPYPREWTRGPAADEVLTNIRTVEEFPPRFRLILFTPEFGSVDSFAESVWAKLCPLEVTDIWVVSWQGWTNWDEMIEQVTRKVLSFADAVSTVWYGHSMGALVAYEVLKRFEESYQTPNLPISLMLSGCPAPHLFGQSYRPHELYAWLQKLRICNDFDILDLEQRKILTNEFQVQVAKERQDQFVELTKRIEESSDLHDAFRTYSQEEKPALGPEHRKAIVNDMRVLQSYHFDHEHARTVNIPVIALCHDEDKLVPASSVEAWDSYALPGNFEFVALEDIMDTEILAEQGHGYSMRPQPELLEKITATLLKHEIDKDIASILPDIGPTDGEMPKEIDCIIVGAGIAGVNGGRAMAETGMSTLILDRYDKVGGIWIYYANQFSRVNSSEPAYRIVDQEGPGARPNEDHSPKHDILRDIYTVAAKYSYGRFRLNIDVSKVTKRSDKTFDVVCQNTKTGEMHKIHAKSVIFHTNRRIGRRRDVNWPGREKFRGECVYGYANEVLGLKFWGKRVVVVGAGAFAYENLRTALEHGARHVTILGRRAGTTCPKWIDMIAFLRPLDEYFGTQKSGNVISFEAWKKCYEDAGLRIPDCWAEGLLKPHNHTISVSDLAYIAGYHGMVDLKVGEIKEFRTDGQGVTLMDGSKVDVDIIIRATGFHLNEEVPAISGKKKIYSCGMLDYNLGYGAEPLLDGAQFGSAKGRLAEDEEIDETALYNGLLEMKKMGLPDSTLRANPFGSAYVGGMLYNNYLTKWLVTHPQEQEAFLECAGEPTQDTVKMWASMIGTGMANTLKRLVAGLGAASAKDLQISDAGSSGRKLYGE